MMMSLAAATLALMLATLPVKADETPAADSIEKIGWGQAPAYIQQQARNVVMHCSAGEYTPNQVKILRYTSPAAPGAAQYLLDFSAMRGLTQQLPGCNYNSPVCGPMGCFLMAYTQTNDGSWDQSWFGLALAWQMAEVKLAGLSFAGIEVTQAPPNCGLVNGGHATCPVQLTWIGGKFKYIGYASLTTGDGSGSAIPAQAPAVTPVAVSPENAATAEEPGQ